MERPNNALYKISEAEYGNNFQNHFLEIYKIYSESADKISERRQSTNSFFLSINTAIIGLISYLQSTSAITSFTPAYILTTTTGVVTCITWHRAILSYKRINTEKFKIIHKMEESLPIAPYQAEWERISKGENSQNYIAFTKIELFIPWIFLSLNIVALCQVVFETF